MIARLIINEIKRSDDVRRSISVGRQRLVDGWLRSLELDPNLTIIRGDKLDYLGDVKIHSRGLTSLLSPDGFSFGDIKGDFWCNDNQLTSLEGAPESVEGTFWCSSNQLTSLEGSPKSVGGSFLCDNNQLTSLEGAPDSVGLNFMCFVNPLTSLKGAPKSVGGSFWCNGNSAKFTEEEVRLVSNVKHSVYV